MLDRLTPPPFQRNTSFNLIKPIQVHLPNGLHIQFVSGGAQEVVRVELIFQAGRWFENNWGVSHFTSNLLSKGTNSKDSFEIAQSFDQYGAHLEVAPSLDVTSFSLYSLVKNLKPVLQLFQEIIMEPTFPEQEIKQGKSIFLQNLKVNNEKTSFLASKLIRKNLFGEDHPYGKDLEEGDVSILDRNQLVTFHKQFFKDVQIIVSGKIDDPIQRMIIETFSGLDHAKLNEKNRVCGIQRTQETYLEKEGSSQTSIRLGKKSLARSHPDYVDLLLLNHILGGYFGSRLMKNIREQKGLSYGISSSIHALKHDSYVVIAADVNKENRQLATQEIRNELGILRSEKIEDEELNTARYHFIGSLQSEITTPFAHAEKLKTILLNNLHPQYYQNMIDRISVITAGELRLTAEKYFSAESFIEVAVG